jgi:hypothetical protein
MIAMEVIVRSKSTAMVGTTIKMSSFWSDMLVCSSTAFGTRTRDAILTKQCMVVDLSTVYSDCFGQSRRRIL